MLVWRCVALALLGDTSVQACVVAGLLGLLYILWASVAWERATGGSWDAFVVAVVKVLLLVGKLVVVRVLQWSPHEFLAGLVTGALALPRPTPQLFLQAWVWACVKPDMAASAAEFVVIFGFGGGAWYAVAFVAKVYPTGAKVG
ncbi:unnamed protein product [Ectocarpus sp. 6 AP-2014]